MNRPVAGSHNPPSRGAVYERRTYGSVGAGSRQLLLATRYRLVLLLSQAAMANWGTSVHGWNEGQWNLEGGEYAICGAGLTSLFLSALNRPCPVSFFCCLQNGWGDQRRGEAPSVASSGSAASASSNGESGIFGSWLG